MPIIGLTDRAAQFPRIGILRKGGEKVSDRQPGKDLTHFRFDTDDEQAAQQFADAYGTEPRAIRIYLPYDGVEENFVTWQEHWAAGGLMHRCDGATCVLRRLKDGTGYDRTPAPCPHAALPRDHRDRCKPVGRLSVIIPELKRLAYVTAITHSIHDIIGLTEQLTALVGITGRLRGIPMILRRTEREISMPDGKGGRVRRTKWLLSVEAAPHWVGMQLEAQERAALPPGAAPRALPAPAAPVPDVSSWADDDVGDAPVAALPPAPVVLPPAPPVNEHGEVLEEILPPVQGRVQAIPNSKYDADGNLHLTLKVSGYNFLIANADPVLAFIDAGDEVTVTYHPETIKGRLYNVVDTITGLKNADGLTPWEQRERESQAIEAEPGEPVEATPTY